MRTFTQAQDKFQGPSTHSLARPNATTPWRDHGERSITHLRRAAGGQAVQRILHTNVEDPWADSTGMVSPHLGLDFSQIPVHSPAPGTIQAKLVIGKSGDEYEREADHVAERVMQMPESRLRACACGGGNPGYEAAQQNPDHERLQTKSVRDGDAGQTSAPPMVADILRSPGQPLREETRGFFEPRFGHDFSQVRVHTSGRAAQSASSMGARAYTVGSHIVFGMGKYTQETAEGRYLLAHELTHVIQQGMSNKPSELVQRIPELPLGAYAAFKLSSNIKALVDQKVSDYPAYRDVISKATPPEKVVALSNHELLSALNNALDHLSFARCVEFLGMRAPSFDELRKNGTVIHAIEDAWKASDVGVRDLVTEPHEEGGWVFMNLIDGSLSIERAKPEGTDFIHLEPPPDVDNSVLVALFHTHPALGKMAKPSPDDRRQDERRGVPDLVAGNTGADPRVFQIFPSGPAVRKHLASETKIPGRSGGIAP
jgi:hypothetical protein